MRYFKSLALMTALTLSSAAFATMPGFPSQPVDYGTAVNQVTATGTYQSAVSFTVPSTTLTIPSAQVRPGAHFTVTIPVMNTTDRTITISDNVSSAMAGDVTVMPTFGPVDVLSGDYGNFTYDLTFPADAMGSEIYGGQPVQIVFKLIGHDTAAEAQNLTVEPYEVP